MCDTVPLQDCADVPSLSRAGFFTSVATDADGFTTAGRTVDLAGDAKTTLLVGDSLLDLILGRGVGDLGRFGVDERLRGDRRPAAERSRLAG